MKLISGFIATIVGFGAPAFSETRTYKGFEMPPFTVLKAEGNIELREYDRHLLAEVRVRGSRGSAASKGFRILAGYIFGGNTGEDGLSEKIDMTVPVTQEADGEIWKIRFMMPSRYTLDSLPKAETDAIRFFEAEGGKELVAQFPGRLTNAKAEAQLGALRDFAAANGMTPGETPSIYFYDDPFTLPWNRRNEIALPIK